MTKHNSKKTKVNKAVGGGNPVTPKKSGDGGGGGGNGGKGSVPPKSQLSRNRPQQRKSSGGEPEVDAVAKTRTSSLTKTGVPDNYVTTCDDDVMTHFDYYHTSLDASNKKLSNQFRRGSHHPVRGVHVQSSVISTAVKQEPVVNVLEKGVDLKEVAKPWCCFGTQQWNGRRYAHGMSTNFSSPRLHAAEERRLSEEEVDFISDWNNVKALYKAHGSDTHLSYILHRVGNSVTIDHLDLTSIKKGSSLFPDCLQIPPEFVDFAKETIGSKDREKIKSEGKSNKDVMSKEAYHKFLHATMKRPMTVDFSKRKDSKGTSDNQFLHHALFSAEVVDVKGTEKTKKLKILAGSDAPLLTSELDEATLTVRSIEGTTMSSLDAFDLWLDNKLLKCPKSVVSYQKDWKITESQWIKTDDLPNEFKFDLGSYMENGEKLLRFLKESVKAGYSYWLYRAPGSYSINLYNISNISVKQNSGSPPATPIFHDRPTFFQPYLAFFGVNALAKYSECLSEAVTEKLTLETNFEPSEDAGPSTSMELNNNNNDINANKVEPIPKIPVNGPINHKIQKLANKLESLVKNIQKHIRSEDSNWIIQNLDEINCKKFARVLECIKGIYAASVGFTPLNQNSIYRHAVEQYFTTCIKLLRFLGPKNERPKLKTGDVCMRQFMTCFCEGVIDVLTFLSNLHDKVDDLKSLEPAQVNEWMYLGCRMNIMRADTMSSITREVYQKTRMRIPADAKFPNVDQDLEKILQLYEKAADQVPNDKSFRVKQRFATNLKDQIIKREELLDEINKKISLAYLDMARYNLTFPAFLQNVVGEPTQQQERKKPFSTGKTFYSRENGIDPSAVIPPNQLTRMRINANNEKIQTLLEKCLVRIQKVNIVDKQLKTVQIMAYLIMGQLNARSFELETEPLRDHALFCQKTASSLQACYDVNICEEGLENNNGRNCFDHVRSMESVYREKAGSDGFVVLARNFAEDVKKINVALNNFSLAKDNAGGETSEMAKEEIERALDCVRNKSLYQKLVEDINGRVGGKQKENPKP